MDDIEYYNKVLALIQAHRKDRNLKKIPLPARNRVSYELKKLEQTTQIKLDLCHEQNQ